MFDVLGQRENAAIARNSIDKLLVVGADEAYCQPCVSPVWDTGLTCHALLEIGTDESRAAAIRGLDWLRPLRCLMLSGTGPTDVRTCVPGGWAFQYANPHYPDLDDTAVIVMAMDRVRRTGVGSRYDQAIQRAVEWIKGMQSRNGGWAAFDVDNMYDYLNNIPFADHGALIDPPTEDVTARCVSMLSQLGETLDESEIFVARRCLPTRHAASGWKLVWALGSELHLRDVVYAVCPERMRMDVVQLKSVKPSTGSCPSKMRMAAGAKTARATNSTIEATSRPPVRHRRPPGRSLDLWLLAKSTIRQWSAGFSIFPAHKQRMRFGMKSGSLRPGSRVFFICDTTDTESSFRLWALARYRNLKASNTTAVTFGM